MVVCVVLPFFDHSISVSPSTDIRRRYGFMTAMNSQHRTGIHSRLWVDLLRCGRLYCFSLLLKPRVPVRQAEHTLHMSSPLPKIHIAGIRIRLRYPQDTRMRHVKETFELKLNGVTHERVAWSWGDLRWVSQSSTQVPANSRISLEVQSDSEVLAKTTFEDIHKLALTQQRNPSWRSSGATVEVNEEHVFATVTLSFRVEQLPGLIDKDSDLWQPQFYPPSVGVYRGGYGGPTPPWDGRLPGVYPGEIPGAPASPFDDLDLAAAGGPSQPSFDAVLANEGKIQYTVSGTRRPKPR
ncbi:hypothetical protein AB1N83_011159 [Pleurotus pulmonarius]